LELYTFFNFLYVLCRYNVDRDGQCWSIYSDEVHKVSDMDQLDESGFVGSEQECSMNFTTN